jgi:hypothetical protein
MAANPANIENAAETGDRLTILEALRCRLAADIDQAEKPQDVAALTLRFTDILAQIEAIPTTRQVSAADEIAQRRAARRRGRAKGSARTARQG